MDEGHGWLERSFERARENIEARPEHLKRTATRENRARPKLL